MLKAHLYTVPESGNIHVRVLQPRPISDAFAEDMRRCGSPAHFNLTTYEWDYPVTPACVLAIQRTADKYQIPIEWSPDLVAFVAEHKKIDDYERQARMVIERLLRNPNEPLPGYVTDTQGGTKLPMRHQMIAYHWGLRFSGLLLAHDPGLGKTRSAVDLCRGWYDTGAIRPMQQIWRPEVGKWGVRGGILVITKAAVVRTIANEFKLWQAMMALEVTGEKKAKLAKAATPAHAHVINYESLKHVVHNEYDGVVADECFPAGTPIRTPDGDVDIDKLAVGDTVLAFDHQNQTILPRRIKRVFCTPHSGPLTVITTRICRIICTHNHPIWTSACGYKPASQVVAGDDVAVSRSDTLSGVWEAQREENRFQGVLSPEGLLFVGMPPTDSPKDDVRCESDTCVQTDERKQPYASARNTGKGFQYFEGYEARASYAWRKRKNNRCRMGVVRGVKPLPSGVVYAASHKNGMRYGAAGSAESRLVQSVAASGDRVERVFSRAGVSKGAGRPENNVLEGSRVVSVGVYQQAGAGFSPLGDSGGVGCVFNLEVEEDHNYFANGVLVHNCHSCSNNSTQTEHTLRLAQRARKRLGLTGTPITNNLESAFYQMLIIDGGKAFGASKTKFIDQFFNSERVGPQGISKNTPKKDAAMEISSRMALCTYFLKKEDCLKDLPEKTHTPLYLEMNDDQARYYEQLKTEFLTFIQDAQVSAQQAAARAMKLRQICQGFVLDDEKQPRNFNSAKVDALVDMLKNKLAGRKVVVWAVFTHEINLLCTRMQAEGIGYVRLDGTITSKKDRDKGLEMWNNDPRVSVFIGQIQMGIGITLHANLCTVPCFDCVYLCVDYSFVNWTQSQDRIHRIGQKFACSYTYLLTKDGVDKNIYEALQAKKNTAHAVHKNGKDFYASLVRGDEPNLAALDGVGA